VSPMESCPRAPFPDRVTVVSAPMVTFTRAPEVSVR
jgi:hypothetical protein